MQDPNEDTEWNDILRSKGILPKKEITEEQVVSLVEETVKEKQNTLGRDLDKLNLDELDELEDDEDEKIILEYRNRRLAELKAASAKSIYGELREISGQDYVDEVNKAGEDVWVVLHLYKQGIPLCTLINNHLSALAKKFPATKFLKSISSTCIANYPDRNLPTIFIYHKGIMKKQFIGPFEFRGLKLTCAELEWLLSESGAIKSDLEEDPRPKVRDVLFSGLRNGQNVKNDYGDDDDDDDDSINDW